MTSRNVFSIAVASMLFLASGRSAVAQSAGTSDRVVILDRVMEFRLAWLGDTTPLWACPAFKLLGQPRDFLQKLSGNVRALLDQDVTTCDDPSARRARASCPRVELEKIVNSDSVATVELIVWHGEYRHRETYTVSRSSGSIGGVQAVKLSGFIQVLHGFNPGDLGPDGPICPRP